MLKLIIAVIVGALLVVAAGAVQSHFNRGPQHCKYVNSSGDGWREYNCQGSTYYSR